MANVDIGLLKLQFNNEVLKIKKYILQAKTQIIHKLTRNTQKLKKKKGTDEEISKFKRKAESVVSEIMFIKKIHHNDLARFGIKNFGNLQKLMDTPIVTEEKAMAKLLAHKCLNSRFKEIVKQFSIVPVNALLQVNPKKQRRKEKKIKAKLAVQSNEKNIETKTDSTNNPEMSLQKSCTESDDGISEESDLEEEVKDKKVSITNLKKDANIEKDQSTSYDEEYNEDTNSDLSENETIIANNKKDICESQEYFISESETDDDTRSTQDISEIDSDSKLQNIKLENVHLKKKHQQKCTYTKDKILNEDEKIKKPKPVHNPIKMLVDLEDSEVKKLNTEKTVDSFFMTDTGDNYLTVALPRKPDPKPARSDDNDGGNRKMRRAALFGNEIISKQNKKPQTRNYKDDSNLHRFHQSSNSNQREIMASTKRKQVDKTNKNDFSMKSKSINDEKLHPSWEAKKKKSALVAFQGKKVVFNE